MNKYINLDKQKLCEIQINKIWINIIELLNRGEKITGLKHKEERKILSGDLTDFGLEITITCIGICYLNIINKKKLLKYELNYEFLEKLTNLIGKEWDEMLITNFILVKANTFEDGENY